MTNDVKALIEAVERGNSRMSLGYEYAGVLPDDLCFKASDAFDGDLNAAKALGDALLPGWRVSSMGEADSTASGWFAQITMRGTVAQSVTAFDQPNPARAWLLAILRAHAQEAGL